MADAEDGRIRLLEPPPEVDLLDFLRRTIAVLEEKAAAGEPPIAIVVTVLHRGANYGTHMRGVREAGTLAMVGVLEAAKQTLLRHLDEHG